MAALNTNRRFRDMNALTPYEQKIYDMKQQGMSFEEIAKALNNKNAVSVRSRWPVIQDKVNTK